MSPRNTSAWARRTAVAGKALARWLLALLAAAMTAAVVMRAQTFLYVPWEARRRGIETAYAMLADAAYWADAAGSLLPLSLTAFVLSLPFAIVVSGLPEARGRQPRIGRCVIAGGLCPLFWVATVFAALLSSEPESLRGLDASDIVARPELAFLVVAGLSGGYCFGRLRTAFR